MGFYAFIVYDDDSVLFSIVRYNNFYSVIICFSWKSWSLAGFNYKTKVIIKSKERKKKEIDGIMNFIQATLHISNKTKCIYNI